MDVRPQKESVSRRVSTYRDRMRLCGMRQVQMWVTDVRTEEFAQEAHRQTAAVAASEYAADDQAFIDAESSDNV